MMKDPKMHFRHHLAPGPHSVLQAVLRIHDLG